jgi:hypothetical protein
VGRRARARYRSSVSISSFVTRSAIDAPLGVAAPLGVTGSGAPGKCGVASIGGSFIGPSARPPFFAIADGGFARGFVPDAALAATALAGLAGLTGSAVGVLPCRQLAASPCPFIDARPSPAGLAAPARFGGAGPVALAPAPFGGHAAETEPWSIPGSLLRAPPAVAFTPAAMPLLGAAGALVILESDVPGGGSALARAGRFPAPALAASREVRRDASGIGLDAIGLTNSHSACTGAGLCSAALADFERLNTSRSEPDHDPNGLSFATTPPPPGRSRGVVAALGSGVADAAPSLG